MKRGFTLIETVVGSAVFLLIAVGVYQGYVSLMQVAEVARMKVTAAALANEQIEIMRNLPYAKVGMVNGIPSGSIPHVQTLTRGGGKFTVTTTIRSIDDPFDGTLGGSPNDTVPSDYKLAQVDIFCANCRSYFPTLSFTTYVAPKSLESPSSSGALFVQVFDANGTPVAGANVHIVNNGLLPTVTIDDTTDNNGKLQIVDAPPSAGGYQITVSKNGYSTEMTYANGTVGNPNPSKPNATVVLQQVTQLSFAIDKVSKLNVSSVTNTCTAVPDVDFTLTGAKTIGSVPTVFKYVQNLLTSASGTLAVLNLEWDTYTATLIDPAYSMAGSIGLSPFTLAPNATQDFRLIVQPKIPNELLVTIRDTSTQLPLTGVLVTLAKTGYSGSQITGQGFVSQTDWSGGGGQEFFTDATKYATADAGISGSAVAGQLRLRDTFGNGVYQTSGSLISSTFDVGSASNFYTISWLPQDQPVAAGANPVRFQIATNNDNLTWNFVGPDGTASTYYTVGNTNISSAHNGTRYLRYKVLLQTANTSVTPNISDIAVTFTSSCTPPGQVFWNGLSSGTYTLTASKAGYQSASTNVSVGSSWQQSQLFLTPL